MPVQTSTEKYILPDGVDMQYSDDSGASWTSLGILAGGATVTHNFDKVELESGNYGKLFSRTKNETMALAPTALWSWDLTNLAAISGGQFAASSTSDGFEIKGGSSSVTLSRFYVRLVHWTNSANTTYDFMLTVFGVDLDSGMEFSLKGANEEGVHEINVAFTGNVDQDLTDGEGLFNLTVKNSALIG